MLMERAPKQRNVYSNCVTGLLQCIDALHFLSGTVTAALGFNNCHEFDEVYTPINDVACVKEILATWLWCVKRCNIQQLYMGVV